MPKPRSHAAANTGFTSGFACLHSLSSQAHGLSVPGSTGPATMATPAPHLHDCVVDGDEVGEQVQVPGGEDKGKKDLALPGDACGQRRTGDNRNTDTPRPTNTQEVQSLS